MARNTEDRNSMALDLVSGLALFLSTIAFFFSSYAVLQAVQSRRDAAPPVQQSGGGGSPLMQRPWLSFLNPPDRVEPGRFVELAYQGGGRVEIVSAYRVNNPNQPNLVNVRLRVQRVQARITGNGDINLARAVAVNTRTNMIYPVTAVRTFGNEPISLYTLNPGQATEATITVQVPEDLRKIDLSIPQTEVFRNVPIAVPQG